MRERYSELHVWPSASKTPSSISLSNGTVHRRIIDMADDILEQVVDEIKAAPQGIFALQVDETTDVTHLAQLDVYVR